MNKQVFPATPPGHAARTSGTAVGKTGTVQEHDDPGILNEPLKTDPSWGSPLSGPRSCSKSPKGPRVQLCGPTQNLLKWAARCSEPYVNHVWDQLFHANSHGQPKPRVARDFTNVFPGQVHRTRCYRYCTIQNSTVQSAL